MIIVIKNGGIKMNKHHFIHNLEVLTLLGAFSVFTPINHHLLTKDLTITQTINAKENKLEKTFYKDTKKLQTKKQTYFDRHNNLHRQVETNYSKSGKIINNKITTYGVKNMVVSITNETFDNQRKSVSTTILYEGKIKAKAKEVVSLFESDGTILEMKVYVYTSRSNKYLSEKTSYIYSNHVKIKEIVEIYQRDNKLMSKKERVFKDNHLYKVVITKYDDKGTPIDSTSYNNKHQMIEHTKK